MNIVCRYKNPASVNPLSRTPPSACSRTISLIPSSSCSCRGASKHLLCPLHDQHFSRRRGGRKTNLEFIQLRCIQDAILVRITKFKYSFQGAHTSGFQDLENVSGEHTMSCWRAHDPASHKEEQWDVKPLSVQNRRPRKHSEVAWPNIQRMSQPPA